MGKWTFDKELEDTAKAAGAGYSLGNKRATDATDTPATPAPNPDGLSNAQVEGGVRYKRGGYVAARPSGKRMYVKGTK